MDRNTSTKKVKLKNTVFLRSKDREKTPYIEYKNTEEWIIIARLLQELENNQDIELKTAPEYVIGYLVEKLRNKDLLSKKISAIKLQTGTESNKQHPISPLVMKKV